jgi:hypothetical protein
MPITNPQLAKSEANIEAKVPAADKVNYQKIVIAGMKVMFSKELNGELMDGLKQSQDPAITASEGIVGILGILYKQSRNTMPIGPMVTAGMALLLQGLDFAEQAGVIKVDAAMIDRATHHYIESLLPKIGITPDKLQAILGKLSQVAKDPTMMAKMKQGGAT